MNVLEYFKLNWLNIYFLYDSESNMIFRLIGIIWYLNEIMVFS